MSANKCPVCRRAVHGSVPHNNIVRHADKAGRICPASGEPMHITQEEL